MGTVNLDTSENPDLFKPYQPPVIANGKHLFEVANDLQMEPSKSSSNAIVKVELRCQDENEDKGKPVFENFVFVSDENKATDKGKKTQEIQEAKFAQFTVACGVMTKEQIKNKEPIPLDQFKGKRCEAITAMETSKDPNTGKTLQRSRVSRYIFEEDEVTSS